MLISLILISIEKPGTKIKKTKAHLNFDLKWVNVTLLLHFFENHPDENMSLSLCNRHRHASKKNVNMKLIYYTHYNIFASQFNSLVSAKATCHMFLELDAMKDS